MTIEQKAQKLACDIRCHAAILYHDMGQSDLWSCLLLAAEYIEAHEADKSRHAAEMREQAERFSEACLAVRANYEGLAFPMLSPFILAPDPLVEALQWAGLSDAASPTANQNAADLRAALDARGLAIVKREAVNGN